MAGPAAPIVAATGIGGIALNNRRNNSPQRLGAQGMNVDQEQLAQQMQSWNDTQRETFNQASAKTLENQVRAGQISEIDARNMLQQYQTDLSSALSGDDNSMGINAPGDFSTGARSAADSSGISMGNPSPLTMTEQDYAAPYGNMNDPGFFNQQDIQGYAQQQQGLYEVDRGITRNMMRDQAQNAMDFARPLERDRNLEQQHMQAQQLRNQSRQQRATNLLSSYTQAAYANPFV
jgi:hypothetical protein